MSSNSPSLKQAWPMALVCICLMLLPLLVDSIFGRRWILVAEGISLFVWFAFRLWRLGSMPPTSRRYAFWLCSSFLVIFAIADLILYYQVLIMMKLGYLR